MKKFLLSFGVILASAMYAVSQHTWNADYTFTMSAPAASPSPAAPSRAKAPAASGGASSPSSSPAPQALGAFMDGTYTGPAVDAYYGTVQVAALVQGGKLADVQFLQYPSDRSTSQFINSQAMPILTSEAIQAQSANVDIVSGATHTSEGFRQSLADALAQAAR